MKSIKTIIRTNSKVLRNTWYLLVLLTITSLVLPAIEGPSLELFPDSDIQGITDSGIKTQKSVLRDRLTTVNTSLLCELGAEGVRDSKSGQRIFLNLFTDAYLVARIQKVERTYSGGLIFTGDLDGIPNSEVILTNKENVMSGNISMPGHFYQVRFVKEGIHRIMEIDNSKFPSELPAIPVNTGSEAFADSPKADSGIYYDVMVVYDSAARTAAGGTTAMETLIDLMITETNTGYSNSNVTQRARLAHRAEVTYDETNFDWSTALSRLQGTSDGYMDDVHTLRNTYGADNVVFIIEGDGAYCGLGYLMTTVSNSFASYAFCVVARDCATGYYSFAHEMGHNMGCHHDRANASGSGAYSYSYGYQAPDKAFRTIMAYNCTSPGCPRVNYYSNPNVNYGGQPMGVIYTDPLAADNRMTLNNTISTFQNFRQSVSITITAPNGGESWAIGSSQNITWTYTGTIANVKLQYSTNNGGAWTDIIASTPNTGTYAWTIPNAPSALCLVRVLNAANEAVYDVSNAVFTIPSSSTITVVSPNGFENWLVGSAHNITWTNTGTITNVKIEYTTNSGGTWNVLSASTTNTGSYSWTIPNTPSTTCKVRVSDAAVSAVKDTSNMYFSLVSSFPAYRKFLSINGDDRTDILWRYYGTGGANRIWITNGIAAISDTQSMDGDLNNKITYIGDEIRDTESDMAPYTNVYVAAQTEIDKLMNDTAPVPGVNMDSSVQPVKQVEEAMNAYSSTPDEVKSISVSEEKTLQAVTDLNWYLEGSGDFNTDGKLDLLLRHYSSGKNLIWIMNGNQLLRNEVLPYTTNLNWKMIGGGDFDGDGKADILWRNYDNGKNIIWIMDGLTFKYGVFIPAAADLNWEMTGIGDMDGNGKLDILWRHKTTGANKIWMMNGTSYVSETSLPAITDLSWKMVGCGDFNNDGKTDLIWRHSNGNNLVWIMNGVSISAFESLPSETTASWKIEN